MRFLKYFFFTSVLGLTVLFVLMVYSGLFHKVVISETEKGEMKIVYAVMKGDYEKSGAIMDGICRRLKLENAKQFGIFFDNPQKVEQYKLRSIAGCIVPTGHSLSPLLPAGIKTTQIPSGKAVEVKFPLKNKLSLSIAVFKIYPRLAEHLAASNYPARPMMEIYDKNNRNLTVLMFTTLKHNFYQKLLH